MISDLHLVNWAERREALRLSSKRCGCHARWLHRRTDRSLGAVTGRLAVSSEGTCSFTTISASWPKCGSSYESICTGRGPKQSDLKKKSKCLCSVGLNTTMKHSAGMNRRVAFEAGFRFSRPASARDVSAPCRRHLTGFGFET